jgi:hypothetical protein
VPQQVGMSVHAQALTAAAGVAQGEHVLPGRHRHQQPVLGQPIGGRLQPVWPLDQQPAPVVNVQRGDLDPRTDTVAALLDRHRMVPVGHHQRPVDPLVPARRTRLGDHLDPVESRSPTTDAGT